MGQKQKSRVRFYSMRRNSRLGRFQSGHARLQLRPSRQFQQRTALSNL
uniref:Ribosomal protein L34 n=1 Tax=Romanomermis culicivorax TaxID=13658 RepID=A0A915L113_ROMCU